MGTGLRRKFLAAGISPGEVFIMGLLLQRHMCDRIFDAEMGIIEGYEGI